jgi:hypothetical protein
MGPFDEVLFLKAEATVERNRYAEGDSERESETLRSD